MNLDCIFPRIIWEKNFARLLAFIVAFAFVIRVAARLYTGADDFWENGYTFFFDMAQNFAEGKGIALEDGAPTAFRVPLYPIFLAAVTFGHQLFLPVVLAQSLIGAGTVLCAALLGREMFGRIAALIAAAVAAIYPYYVVHDTAMQETSLFTFLTILAVLVLMRARRKRSTALAILAGLILGGVVLTRANLAPFALLAPLWLAVPEKPESSFWRQRFQIAVLCAGTLALSVSPWLVRSYWLTGSPALSTQSGFFLWLGNNPMTFSHYPDESIDRSQQEALKSLGLEQFEVLALGKDEDAVDKWYFNKALDYMREHPWQTFVSGLRKNVAAFGWLPSPRRGLLANLGYALSYAPVMILGLWGMWWSRRHWRDHLIFYALFASFAAVSAVYFGHTSYRSYLDVYWIIFAAGWIEYKLGGRALEPLDAAMSGL